MQYQITYFSPSGHAAKLAAAYHSTLPSPISCRSLESHPSTEADIYLVGFDFTDATLESIPEEVVDFLKKLEGKTILLFATVPFRLSDIIDRNASNAVIQALPRECDYLGLYLCPAQPSPALTKQLADAMARDPNNWRARHWHEQCVQAMGHPDEADLQNGCRFARHVLRLDG